MRRFLGPILVVLLLIWGCSTLVEKAGREVEENHLTILYSHFMSGYLEPCG